MVEFWLGKHAHRSGKHAMWWSDQWVSMPPDRQACNVVWLGKYAHRAGKHAMGWSGILVGQVCSAVATDLTGDDLQVLLVCTMQVWVYRAFT